MAFQGDSIYWVEVEKIVPNPFQPRREFDESKLKELSESIRMYGILQPLTVTRNEIQRDDGAFYTEYELIAGERRLRASKLAGLAQVPVIIRSGEDTEQEKLELAIIENLQREDLNAVDRALAFKQLAEVFKLSHAQVAKKVGRSREYVSNSIRLLGLPECMLNSLRLGDLSEGHARTLLMLKERPEEQDVVYREILLKKLSVREVERIARKIATDKVRKKTWDDTDAHLIEFEKEFTSTLGTRVQIAKTDFGGKLTIDYFSDDDLHKLLEMMQKQGKITDKQTKDNDSLEGTDESQTVIQEMSPEASIMAKIAVATPLEIVKEDVVTEDVVIEVPTPVVQDIPDTVEEIEVSVERPERFTDIAAMPEPEVFTEEAVGPAVVNEQPVETVVSSEVVPEQVPENRIPVDLESEEFAFVTKHTEEAREQDLIPPLSNFNPFQKREVIPEAKTEEPEPEPEIPVVPEVQEEDSDMYSMKNFTL
ncbi:MAG: ParB family chromosome partitioning protein [Acidimicrobiales bacterium]|jgi:ParB family chromosome partitioning protein